MEAKNKLKESLDIKPEKTPLEDGYTIEVIPGKNTTLYIFRDPEGNESANYKHTEPLTLTELCTVGKEIKKHMDSVDGYGNPIDKKSLGSKFEEIKVYLNKVFDKYISALKLEETIQHEEKEQELQLKLEEAQILLESKPLPLIYIGSLVSWMTAGERANIMLTFIAYCSQVVLKTPTSVIGLGEGGSGKTHIQEVAMSLIPKEFIRYEKSIKEAAMFNRAKEDPYYYDGCVVSYGDLGGKNSQDFVIEAKNLLKELQSDGFINKPLNIPTDEGWMVVDLTLYGYPCLTYTTVPGFAFDDQEMSRSIFITPRMDNKSIFFARKQIMGLKHGKTYKRFKKHENEIKIVKYMVSLLRKRMEEITIINPYSESVIKFLGESEYFKRDFDKYDGILRTITAFHAFSRDTFNLGDEEILFTSLNDIKFFMSLLMAYHESISVNISPKASEILLVLREKLDKWEADGYVKSLLGITTNEFFELTSLNLQKRSIQRYFGELNQAGFIKVVGKESKSNVYQLSERNVSDEMDNLLTMTEAQENLISRELGKTALDFIKSDEFIKELSILWHDPDVEVPGWEDYDN